jgi:NagD protein
MLETATGIKAFSVGKPSPVMMRSARKELGLTTAETTMIGDTMETDILGGVQMGYRTILVLSGGTQPEDLVRYAYRPDLVVDSIANLCANSILDDVSGASRAPVPHFRQRFGEQPPAVPIPVGGRV